MTGEGESHAKISINQRRKRRLVEKYREPVAWTTLKEDSLAELAHDVAGLPSEQEPEDEEAKRFDLLRRTPTSASEPRRAPSSGNTRTTSPSTSCA
jgi:type I site-specific restriction endonuclease